VKSIISQMDVFGGDDHKYVPLNILTNYLFQMEDDKICEVGQHLTFQTLFGWLIQTQT
jgi:hypothetical protein